MKRRNEQRVPLGSYPKVIRISEEEMHRCYLHRVKTGEPIQSWVRRLIRENGPWEEPTARELGD
jgi:hypothetical protein